jgi:predicted amidohydrolase YtcJ
VATPDVVFTGGVVVTMDPSLPRAEAVAIGNGVVTAVGRADEVGDLVGPATRLVDLRGRTLLPGFQDSHVHPPSSGLERMRCDLSEAKGAEAVLQSVREYAASHPDLEWITGGGWTLSDFPGGTPGRQLLDEAVRDRPAFLTNRDGHGAWVSSAALRMAEITAETADPVDGRIEREADGSPAGMLHEGAMDLVEPLIPPPSMEEWFQAILEAQSFLHSLGITAWQDAWVLDDHLRAYAGLDERRSLTARVIGALWWDRDRGLEQVPELIERRSAYGGFDDDRGRFRAPTVKIMQDGICENFTAGMIEPYLDAESGTDSDRRGLSFVDPELLKEAVIRLDAEGFQVHFHAIGDRAVREALDAVDSAREANGPSRWRHHIAHLQVVHPDDLPRFAALDVVANCQPFWAALDDQMRDLNVPILGPERVRTQYPFESLRRSGARLAFGSDWSVTTPDPFAIMQVAMTRVPFGEPEVEPFLPQERLDLETSLDAATRGSAFVNHLDGTTGAIRQGMAADLAVVDRDLFGSDPTEIGQAGVDLTLLAGEAVFDRAGELS